MRTRDCRDLQRVARPRDRTSARKRSDRVCHKKNKSLRGATTAKQIFKTEENRTSMSPRPSKYPSSSGSPRSSVARDPKTRARENTRRSPANPPFEKRG